MADDEPNQEVIRHYKRTHAGASDKELVEERIERGSDTWAFLQRMDHNRRARAAQQGIDMRGKTRATCRAVQMDGVTHYVDDVGFNSLSARLEQEGGRYTVGVREDVLGQLRMLHARPKEQARSDRAPPPAGDMASSPGNDPGIEADPVTTAEFAGRGPQPIPIVYGYFRARSEHRFKLYLDIAVEIEGRQYTLKTRDLSLGGLRARSASVLPEQPGAEARVSFSAVNIQDSPYTILAVEAAGDGTELRMQRCTEADDTAADKALRDYLEKNTSRRDVEAGDERQTVDALLAEHAYVASVPGLPFVVRRDGQITIFEAAGGGDAGEFQFLAEPDRAESLTAAAQEGRGVLVAQWPGKEDCRIHSACDIDQLDDDAWRTLVATARRREGFRLYRLALAEPAPPLSRKVAEHLSSPVAKHAPDKAEALVEEQLAVATATGLLFDITDAVDLVCPPPARQVRPELSPRGSDLARIEVAPCAEPPCRQEERYLVQTEIGFKTGRDGPFRGITRDLSTSGACIRIGPATSEHIEVGDVVWVTFNALDARKWGVLNSNPATDVPYEVLAISPRSNGPHLHLRRQAGPAWVEVSESLRRLMQEDAKVALDIEDRRILSVCRCLSAQAAENAPGLSLLVRNRAGSREITHYGMPPEGNPLTRFLTGDTPEPMLASITDKRFTQPLIGAVTGRKAQRSASRLIHLQRAKGPVFLSAADDALAGAARTAFIDGAPPDAYMLLRMTAYPVPAGWTQTVDEHVKPLVDMGRHVYTQAVKEWRSLEAVIHVLPVTD